jgi:FKBP-type peptidyl-prolyl cis-trans isomerase 2
MKHPWPTIGIVALVWAGLSAIGAAASGAEGDLKVADGKKVTIEYTLTLSDQTVVDDNVGKVPFTYTQGQPEILQSLQKALVGLKAGQRKKVELLAEQAYGLYDKKATMTIERSKVPAETKVGSMLRSPDGRAVQVLDITDKSVVLDMNHPLAGKNVTFDVKVLKVEG